MTKIWTLLAVIFVTLVGRCAQCENLADVKKLWDGAEVMVSGVVTLVEPSECYIENSNRSMGIWVQAGTAGVGIGDTIIVSGYMSTISGERIVRNAGLYFTNNPVYLEPVGMSNKWIGGSWFGFQDCVMDYPLTKIVKDGWQRRWAYGQGLNNTGLLVRTWGLVRQKYYSPINDTSWFYIDDGYEATADLGDTGILVYGGDKASCGDYVAVTGISSVEAGIDDGSRLIRVIRPRNESDIDIMKAYDPPVDQMSDEFDGPKISPQWAVMPNNGYISASSNPGWLKMIMPAKQSVTGYKLGPCIVEKTSSFTTEQSQNPSFEIKFRPDFADDRTSDQWIILLQSSSPVIDVQRVLHSTGILAAVECFAGRWMTFPSSAIEFNSGDTCYFKFSDGCLGVSSDGVNYRPMWIKETISSPYIAFCMISTQRTATERPFTVYLDYIRFAQN